MGEFERNKDQLQSGIQAGASLVGRITVIITDAIGSIAREVGDFVTDGIEMREAARAARADELARGEDDETDTGPSVDSDTAPPADTDADPSVDPDDEGPPTS